MKKFQFPLNRVMEFRRMQARLEEIKLEAIYAELRAIDARETALIEQNAQSDAALKSAESATGFDLELFDSFRQGSNDARRRLETARAGCRNRIQAQLHVVATKRRDVKLLEKLKEQRFEKWEKEMLKEIDQQAEEAYLAKWGKP